MKVDEELLDGFDKLEGSRSSNIVKAMAIYLKGNTNEYQTNQGNTLNNIDELKATKKNLADYNTFLKARVEEFEKANSELRKSLAFEQQAHFEAQKQLPSMKKSRWKFWK